MAGLAVCFVDASGAVSDVVHGRMDMREGFGGGNDTEEFCRIPPTSSALQLTVSDRLSR